jgi:hypothetical protein
MVQVVVVFLILLLKTKLSAGSSEAVIQAKLDAINHRHR